MNCLQEGSQRDYEANSYQEDDNASHMRLPQETNRIAITSALPINFGPFLEFIMSVRLPNNFMFP